MRFYLSFHPPVLPGQPQQHHPPPSYVFNEQQNKYFRGGNREWEMKEGVHIPIYKLTAIHT